MVFACQQPRSDAEAHEDMAIALAIVDATPDPLEEATLVAIAWFESGLRVHAVGKLGEQGPWQLMPPAPKTVHEQAKEALRRWKVQGAVGYTGERTCPCPLAVNRRLRGAMLAAAYAP